jgi:hypothetical protein
MQLQQMAQQSQQLQQALEKAQADKNQAEVLKQQNAMKDLEIKTGQLQLEKMKVEGELALKEKELQLTGKTKDLEVSAQVEMSEKKNQVELIKVAQQGKEEPKPIEEKSEKPQKPPVVNVYNGGTKVSEITKTGEGSYKVVTEDK